MLEALWHSIINVGIVIASIVVAILFSQEKRPGLKALGLFLAGVLLYAFIAYFGVTNRDCELATSTGLWEWILSANSCIESDTYDVAVAQTFIIAALIVWLGLAWRAVFRKIELEEREEKNET